MFIPPKQRKHISQTSTCLSLLKCLVYIVSCRLYVGVSTILNPTPDLTHFQTHACKVPRIYPKIALLAICYSQHHSKALATTFNSHRSDQLNSYFFHKIQMISPGDNVCSTEKYLKKFPARSKQVCCASEERATLSNHALRTFCI